MDLSKLVELSTAKRLGKGAVIIKEGATMPYSMYIVLSGSVRVVKSYGAYDQMLVATLYPGDFFGEMSLFLMKPRTATVVTIEETVVLEINQSNVYEVIQKDPQFLFSVLKTLCTRIDDLNEKVKR